MRRDDPVGRGGTPARQELGPPLSRTVEWVRHRWNPLPALLLGILLLLFLVGVLTWHLEEPTLPRTEVSLVAAGDIAGRWWSADEATARLLDRIDGTILALGDNEYPAGSERDYARYYAPTWGRHLRRTRPVPGNHDYGTDDGATYYRYFGTNAGEAAKGYYSFDVDGWHVVALNSAIDVGPDSPQLQWLRADLAAHPSRCTLAYSHHPRFSSGKHGSQVRMSAAWQILYDAGVEVVLSGHDHTYERFAPMTPEGRLDPARGVRQFVVGTGGAPLYRFGAPVPNSQLRDNHTHGVLALTLGPDAYSWKFIPIAGETFSDSGRASCH